MRIIVKTLCLTVAVAAISGTALLLAQDNNQGNGPGRAPGPPGRRGHRPPPPLIIGALDANHDGVIDADEIANASAVLRSLDKNGDGKLTPDEFMGPPPPPPPGGPEDGPPPGGPEGSGDKP
jgi:hypothetical protein